MEELKRTRDETQAARVTMESEPQPSEKGDKRKGSSKIAGPAMEKRKRMLEERRQMIAKRHKPDAAEGTPNGETPTTSDPNSAALAAPLLPSTTSADDFLATLEEDWKHARG